MIDYKNKTGIVPIRPAFYQLDWMEACTTWALKNSNVKPCHQINPGLNTMEGDLLGQWWCVLRGSLGDMKIDVVVASISCLGNFPTNHG